MGVNKKYSKNQKLVHIDSGRGNPVLEFYPVLSPLFSKDFLAEPGEDSVKIYKDNREINWVFGLEDAKQVNSLSEEIKELLNKEEKKLARKILELKKSLEEGFDADDNQLLTILNNFSFDWENPTGKIYKDGDRICIVDWGVTGDDGETIPPPEFSDEPKQKDENPIVDQPVIAPIEYSFWSKVKDYWNNNRKWLRWVIGLFLVLFLLLLKNCNPYAEISLPREDRNGEKIYFHSSNSHDSTSFWSTGLFKETAKLDLDRKWRVFKSEINDTSLNLVHKGSRDRFSIDRESGIYLVHLKITDKGNKFGFNVKTDFDTLLFKIPEEKEDTIIIVSLPPDSKVTITGEVGGTKAKIPPGLITGGEPNGTGAGGEPTGTGAGGEPTGTGAGGEPTGTGAGGEPTGTGAGGEPTGTGTGGEGSGEGSGGVPIGGAAPPEGTSPTKRGPGKYELKYQYEDPLGAGYTKIRIEERKDPESPWKVKEEFYLDPEGRKKRRLSKRDKSIINSYKQSKNQSGSKPVSKSDSGAI